MSRRELLAYVVLAAGFMLASTALIIVFGDGGSLPLGPAVVLTLGFAVLSRVRFDAGSGYTVPTQLLFVPMLFVVEPLWAPVLAAAGMTLGQLHAVVADRQHLSRLLTGPGNAWFALGPALVFALTDPGSPDLGDWPIYLLALGTQFLLDFVVGAVGEWISHGVAPELQLRVMAPIWAVDMMLSPIGLMAAIATETQPYAFVLVLPLAVLMAAFAREHRARIEQAIELSSAYRKTALLLGDVIGADDSYTGDHSQGVVKLAIRIGEHMKLNADDLRLVELGALLHDVGKIVIPKEIVNKPGPLDDDEWAIVRTHTLVGQQMLDRVGGALSDVGQIVRSSHEHFDGNGYPDGRSGAAIPLPSRIVAVADAHSAMTTDRVYRPRLAEAEALRRLRRGAGTQFDPDVITALFAVLEPRPQPPGRRAHALVR
ncbi:MAG: HD-GYP domain-containing protein [Solirubrobacteraceae bacterium]